MYKQFNERFFQSRHEHGGMLEKDGQALINEVIDYVSRRNAKIICIQEFEVKPCYNKDKI